MKIRTQFTCMVVGILLIPILLLGVGWSFFSMNENPLPAYSELPQSSESLTDFETWNKVRQILAHRPDHTEVFVFDQSFRLIYSTTPLPIPAGSSISPEAILSRLKSPNRMEDFFYFEPAETNLRIALVQDKAGVRDEPLRGILLLAVSILLGMLLVAVLFSIVLGRNLTRSIVKLNRAVAQVAEGDLESRVDGIKGNDEILALGRSFETLRASLQEEKARESRFVMGVSHDLKSPMAVIKGYVELLRDGPVTTPQARQNYFDLILDKVDQLDTMIDHLIDYGRVNTGEWQQTWAEVPLKAFLEEFAGEAAPDAALLGRTFQPELDELPADLTFFFESRSVRRCLENLVNNALRYTAPGDTVGLRALAWQDGVELTVWDNGPGLNDDDLPHLFEMFYRGTASRRETGLGLGLSIVKTIIDSHGWSIRAESDGGARFTITMPYRAER